MFGVGTATLVAATVVVPRFAGAAEGAAPSVKLEICNNTYGSSDINVNIVGTNQDGQKVSAPTVRVGRNDLDPTIPCTTLENWWWRVGTDLDVKYVNIQTGFSETGICHIPQSLADGSTHRVWPIPRSC
jgi:hypothetical protein